MKHILLFGAGKSATVLIDYLKQLATDSNYRVTVADGMPGNAHNKVGEHPLAKGIEVNVENAAERSALVQQADVVISLLPPSLHYLVAMDCIAYDKHLLTASYIDDKIKPLQQDIDTKGLLFLCEMGLDPGIDHMSAMHLIHRIQEMGGNITSFKSHCGGLVAPESDDNPWHYKISWNPRNVVLAGKAGAIFKEDGQEKRVEYKDLFTAYQTPVHMNDMQFGYYPNRDSLSYIPVYGLESATTFIRTTLRHPDFNFGWKNIVDLNLTDETTMYNTDGVSFEDFYKSHLPQNNFTQWYNETFTKRLGLAKELTTNLQEIESIEKSMRETGQGLEDGLVMVDEGGALNSLNLEELKAKSKSLIKMQIEQADLAVEQLLFLDLNSPELINKGMCSAADVLQLVLERKLALKPEDKDMIVMIHELEFAIGNEAHYVKSCLLVKGKDSVHTAMAKTVGLPLGIAAKLLLEGKLTKRGLHIPIDEDIYTPVLAELENHGIAFNETFEVIYNAQ